MNLSERQSEILNRIVQEYIESAQPVSSQLLEKKYDFNICPATIRIEMQKLTDKGFLSQPHTSAGRIPTDRGYRFFVDNLLNEGVSEFEDIIRIEKILEEGKEDILRFAYHLSKFLAETSSNLAAIHLIGKDFFLKEGWEEVLEEPEFEEKDLVFGFARLLENFENNIGDLQLNSKIKVYIGKENPFPKAKDFSIISSKCILPDEEKGIISLLGPKRMEYEKNISLINSLVRIMEEF
jgi:transcriptional regulator of heat shock response